MEILQNPRLTGKQAFAGVFMIVACASGALGEASRAIPAAPAELWKAEAKADGKVGVSSAGDVIAVKYDVDVKDSHSVGHQVFKQASFRLLLKEAFELRDDEFRISFESAGQDPATVLCPLIRDEGGAPERFHGERREMGVRAKHARSQRNHTHSRR